MEAVVVMMKILIRCSRFTDGRASDDNASVTI